MGRFGHHRLVSERDAVESVGRAWVPYTCDQIRAAPKVAAGKPISRGAEHELLRHYGIAADAGRFAELEKRPADAGSPQSPPKRLSGEAPPGLGDSRPGVRERQRLRELGRLRRQRMWLAVDPAHAGGHHHAAAVQILTKSQHLLPPRVALLASHSHLSFVARIMDDTCCFRR
jgi:hypothetical protein